MPKKLDLKIPQSKRTRNAKRLLALRKAMNLSQSELAKYFGITTGAGMLWEKGDRKLYGPALKLLELFEKMASGEAIDFTMEAQK
jgi:DNA-binding transcriptional regulator YiaG